jgi:hypothetical protein
LFFLSSACYEVEGWRLEKEREGWTKEEEKGYAKQHLKTTSF